MGLAGRSWDAGQVLLLALRVLQYAPRGHHHHCVAENPKPGAKKTKTYTHQASTFSPRANRHTPASHPPTHPKNHSPPTHSQTWTDSNDNSPAPHPHPPHPNDSIDRDEEEEEGDKCPVVVSSPRVDTNHSHHPSPSLRLKGYRSAICCDDENENVDCVDRAIGTGVVLALYLSHDPWNWTRDTVFWRWNVRGFDRWEIWSDRATVDQWVGGMPLGLVDKERLDR